MKAELSGWPIVGGLVLAMLFCGAGQARATNIDFEDLLPLAATGTEHILAPAMGVATGGFYYTPDPARGDSFNDLHISNAEINSSYNESIVAITHNDGILTKVGGGVFSLQRFDFAGFPTDKEVSFTVTGVRDGFPTITQHFNLNILSCLADCLVDGKVDGKGGVDDFQTFYLDSNWTNLMSVRWTHTGDGTIRSGLFALDNIVVNEPKTVPEPSSITLLGLGTFFLLGQGWLARKRLKTLGVRTHSRAHKMSKTPAH